MAEPRSDRTKPSDVRGWLVAFFLELPGAPVYAASGGGASFLDRNKSASTFDWLALSSEVLGRGSKARLWLLTWARAEARRTAIDRDMRVVPGGGTVAEFCREFGVRRSTFDRTVDRSLKLLAREWDLRRDHDRS